MHSVKAVLLKLHAKLAQGWALIRVNFEPIQEIWSKVRGESSFVRLQYTGYIYLPKMVCVKSLLHINLLLGLISEELGKPGQRNSTVTDSTPNT